jgi:hypothetical protein
MRKLTTALAVLGFGAALAVTPVLASPAFATPASTCKLTISSLDMISLQHDGDADYVFLKVGQTWGPSGNDGVKYTDSTDHHTGAAFGPAETENFVDEIKVKLVLDEFPFNDTVDVKTIPCVAVTNVQQRFSDGDGIYDMTYTVTAS